MIPNKIPVKDWSDALTRAFGGHTPSSTEWTKVLDISRRLKPFVQAGIGHTMVPGGGGQDFVLVTEAGDIEEGCLEFYLIRAEPLDKEDPGTAGTQAEVVYLCKPRNLRFEHFPDSPVNSFFLLETSRLEPSGVYDNVKQPVEEVLVLGGNDYRDRSHFYDGNLGHDKRTGQVIPLPPRVRLLTRYLQPGKFLIVAKESLWFKRQASQDGRHNKMTSKEIRAEIQAMIDGGTK